MARPVISLTTDFGTADGYAGTMKGVMLGICPEAALVDISHEIHPQAVQQAAHVLSTAVPYFTPGAVHLVVVDPGVGSERRPIAVQTGRATYVAPDNGVLSLALAQDPAHLAVHLTESRYHLAPVSATFHGRDIFAPVAAHLARGIALLDMGIEIPISDLVPLPLRPPEQQSDGSWWGTVLHIDRFGNLTTDIQAPIAMADPQSSISILVGDIQIVGLSRTYADVAPGEMVAYVGSSGHLEIAVREGNAAVRLGLDVGAPVQVRGLVPGTSKG